MATVSRTRRAAPGGRPSSFVATCCLYALVGQIVIFSQTPIGDSIVTLQSGPHGPRPRGRLHARRATRRHADPRDSWPRSRSPRSSTRSTRPTTPRRRRWRGPPRPRSRRSTTVNNGHYTGATLVGLHEIENSSPPARPSRCRTSGTRPTRSPSPRDTGTDFSITAARARRGLLRVHAPGAGGCPDGRRLGLNGSSYGRPFSIQ